MRLFRSNHTISIWQFNNYFMRIGIVINTSWNIYNFRKGLITHLLKKGHEIFALAPEDEYTSRLSDIGCSFHHTPLSGRGIDPVKDIAYMFRLHHLYCQLELDIVLHFTIKPNIYGSIAANMAGIPAINNVTGLGTVFMKKDWLNQLGQMLYRFAFRYPEKVFFQNSDDLSLFLKNRLVRKQITSLLPGSGVNLQHFAPVPFKRNRVFCFLMVSRMLNDKGIREYLAAAKALKKEGFHVKFQVLGNADHTGKHGLNQVQINYWQNEGIVEYLGTASDVRPFIEKADCIVLPSYREGTPRALLEAASQQKPLLTTNAPGCRETVIDGFNGYLCQVKDASDLASKMKKIALLPLPELEKMALNSRRLAEQRFDENLVIKSYEKALAEVMGVPVPATELASSTKAMVTASISNF